MRLSQLVEKDNLIIENQPFDDKEILCVCYRIEDVVPGCLFICLKRSRTNTHEMIPYILAHGAVAIMVEEEIALSADSTCTVIPVRSSRRALAYAFSAFSYHPARKLKIYGITGTNGKTSASVFLDAIFRAAGYKTALIGTLGCYINGKAYKATNPEAQNRLTTMTTPDPDILYPFLRELVDHQVTHVTMEVSSHALALDKVAPICFEGAGFTNLSAEHQDFHQTMEAYKAAKRKLFGLAKCAAINTDDQTGASLAKEVSCPVLTCGIIWNAEIMASELEPMENGAYRFMISDGNAKDFITLKCAGQYQIYNALIAATIAKQAGITGKVIRDGIESVSEIPGRLELISTLQDDIRVYIDFAHTEYSLRNLLLSVRKLLHGEARLILVFGCGGDRDKSKRAPMGACAEALADFSIITSDNARTESPSTIISDILCGYTSADSWKVIADRQKAIEYAIQIARAGDWVLIVGKGHESYEIRGTQLFPFDERKIILDAIKQRNHADTIREPLS